MKVLLLNGSAVKNGNTFVALSEIAKTLEAEGVEAEIVQIGNKPVRGCVIR
jgi:multimeric flavodoxin WrbA